MFAFNIFYCYFGDWNLHGSQKGVSLICFLRPVFQQTYPFLKNETLVKEEKELLNLYNAYPYNKIIQTCASLELLVWGPVVTGLHSLLRSGEVIAGARIHGEPGDYGDGGASPPL